MSQSKHKVRTSYRGRLVRVVIGLAVLGTLAWGVQPASASTAHRTGEHSVCAQTLTEWVYENGAWSTATATAGTGFYITAFYAPNWVYGYSRGTHKWGFVHNGWFC